MRGVADDDRARRRDGLKARRDVRHRPDDVDLRSRVALVRLAGDHDARVQPDPHAERDAERLPELRFSMAISSRIASAACTARLGIVLVGARVAEVRRPRRRRCTRPCSRRSAAPRARRPGGRRAGRRGSPRRPAAPRAASTPTMSQNITVMCRRCANVCPFPPAAGASSSGSPHAPQNLIPLGLSSPHRRQFMVLPTKPPGGSRWAEHNPTSEARPGA